VSPTVAFVLVAVIVPFIVAECSEVAPALAAKLLLWSARRLGDPEKIERYGEEWLADLQQVPGKLTKLAWAVGTSAHGVFQMRTKAPRLNWKPRQQFASPFETDSIFGPGNALLATHRTVVTVDLPAPDLPTKIPWWQRRAPYWHWIPERPDDPRGPDEAVVGRFRVGASAAGSLYYFPGEELSVSNPVIGI
jgi:hypothetical protein